MGVLPCPTQTTLRVIRTREAPAWYASWPDGQISPRWEYKIAAYIVFETSCIRVHLLLPLYWGKADEGCAFNAVDGNQRQSNATAKITARLRD